MSYIEMKKKAKKSFLLQVKYLHAKGQKPMAPVNMWCEFCMKAKKRWEVKLVGQENLKHVTDPMVIDSLKQAPTPWIMCCEDCRKKHEMLSLMTDEGAFWDGEAEAMKELFGDKHAR